MNRRYTSSPPCRPHAVAGLLCLLLLQACGRCVGEWLVAAVDGRLSEASWPAFIAPPAPSLDDDDIED
jgi:hypothetical protein